MHRVAARIFDLWPPSIWYPLVGRQRLGAEGTLALPLSLLLQRARRNCSSDYDFRNNGVILQSPGGIVCRKCPDSETRNNRSHGDLLLIKSLDLHTSKDARQYSIYVYDAPRTKAHITTRSHYCRLYATYLTDLSPVLNHRTCTSSSLLGVWLSLRTMEKGFTRPASHL